MSKMVVFKRMEVINFKGLKDTQDEIEKWARYNFGDENGNIPWQQPLMGIIEEVGELHEAIINRTNSIERKDINTLKTAINTDIEILDALGDIMVYALHLCAIREWNIETIIQRAFRYNHTLPKLMEDATSVWLGKLFHSLLKQWQNIRGDQAGHELDAQENLGRFLFSILNFCDDAEIDLGIALSHTWERVSKRDWKKNSTTGA